MTLNLQVGGPMNTFCVDLRRALLPAVRQARQAQPDAALIGLALEAMRLPARMWTWGSASDAEKRLYGWS